MPIPAADTSSPAQSPPRPSSQGSGRTRLGILIAWLPALVVLIPVLAIFLRLWEPAGESWAHLSQNLLPTYLWHTGVIVGGVTILALIFGVPTAWWIATYEFPGRKLLQWALLLPLAMPGYMAALAYMDATEALVPMYVWFRQHYGVDAFRASQEITRWVLAILVLGATLFPYVYLTSLAAFSRQTAGAIEAARLLGARGWRLYWSVALPMARPAIVAGASLVVFETLNDYGVSSYFGLTPLTVGVFRAWLSEGEITTAIRLAALLLILALTGIALEKGQRGRRAFETEPSDKPLTRRRPSLVKQWLVLCLCLIPLSAGFLIPAYRLSIWAWSSSDPAAWAASLAAAWHSFSLAAMAALLVVVSALLLSGARRAWKATSLPWAQKIGMLGYAFPSALVAVGIGALLSQASQWPGFGFVALSASVTGLVFAYYVRFLAVGIQPIDSGFSRISPSLHDAARTLGSRPWAAVLRIDLPLLWPSVMAAVMLVFIDVFKELTLTLVLRPFNYETLATRIYRLTDESRIPEAALPALILVGLSLLGLIPLTRLSNRNTSS